MKTILLFIALAATVSAFAKRLQSEAAYQASFAEKIGGQTEVIMDDGTRCDILTQTHAIEVDFADKWGESIGQALNYSLQTQKHAGIVLILESQDDYRHFIRVNSIVEYHGLKTDIWLIKAYEGEAVNRIGSATAAGDYWISSTDMTHREGCRYFGSGKGRASNTASGKDCKVCGGASGE